MNKQDDIADLIFKLNDGASKPGKYLDDVLMRLAADALTRLRQRVEELERVLNNTRADAQYRVARLTTERDEARAQRDEWERITNAMGMDLVRSNAERITAQSAIRMQVENIERWLETGEPSGPQESRRIYETLKAAITRHSEQTGEDTHA